MSTFEESYLAFVSSVLVNSERRESRVGPTRSSFGTCFRIDCMRQGKFPVLTTRKMHTQGIIGELAAFLTGYEDLAAFKDFGCNYWDDNAAKWVGNLGVTPDKFQVGRIYGAQWRNWGAGFNQLQYLIDCIKKDPFSRRHLLTTYNPSDLHKGCLPPCHLLAQYQVSADKNELNCIVTMRSVDLCLGLPSDIVLYAALLLIVCQQTGYAPGMLTFMMGDTHVYENHLSTFDKQLDAEMHKLPEWRLDPSATIDNFVPSMFWLYDYASSPSLKYPLNT